MVTLFNNLKQCYVSQILIQVNFKENELLKYNFVRVYVMTKDLASDFKEFTDQWRKETKSTLTNERVTIVLTAKNNKSVK